MTLYDVGIIGLGVMGAQLARNVASRTISVAGYERNLEQGKKVAAAYPEAKLEISESLAAFVASLAPPRRIIVMVPAGAPVDAVLDGLDPLLAEGDVVADGGNSHYADTERRQTRGKTWRFLGMGVSGGSEGALKGPAIMPGGDAVAYARMQPVLEAIGARSKSGVCVAYCGAGSAGHFVKMVHNGIEYGDMQLISETTTLMERGLGMSHRQASDVFGAWNKGDLESFLIEITADVLRAEDADKTPLVDKILDAAGQKGTGKWTVIAALDHGVAIPTIAAAVDARNLSSQKALRVRAEKELAPERTKIEGVSIDDLADALYAAKLASYTQGFALLRAASEAKGYGTDLSEVARIWTGGCIIRARFLDRVREAFAARPNELLLLAPEMTKDVVKRVPALRRTVAGAARAGIAIPGLAASLTWFDTLTTGRGSAWMIQAQRDYFGSHGYERIDNPGVPAHSEWPRF